MVIPQAAINGIIPFARADGVVTDTCIDAVVIRAIARDNRIAGIDLVAIGIDIARPDIIISIGADDDTIIARDGGVRGHGDVDRGGIGAAIAVRDLVADLGSAGEARVRGKADAAIGQQLDRTICRGWRAGQRQRIAIDIGVIGQRIDHDRRVGGGGGAVIIGHRIVIHRIHGHRHRGRGGQPVRIGDRIGDGVFAVEIGVRTIGQNAVIADLHRAIAGAGAGHGQGAAFGIGVIRKDMDIDHAILIHLGGVGIGDRRLADRMVVNGIRDPELANGALEMLGHFGVQRIAGCLLAATEDPGLAVIGHHQGHIGRGRLRADRTGGGIGDIELAAGAACIPGEGQVDAVAGREKTRAGGVDGLARAAFAGHDNRAIRGHFDAEAALIVTGRVPRHNRLIGGQRVAGRGKADPDGAGGQLEIHMRIELHITGLPVEHQVAAADACIAGEAAVLLAMRRGFVTDEVRRRFFEGVKCDYRHLSSSSFRQRDPSPRKPIQRRSELTAKIAPATGTIAR